MAFRAWNRGLAATEIPQNSPGETFPGNSTNAFGVWLYNGTSWFPDPTFPGASECPGNTVLWAGKLDYWLIPSQSDQSLTLCRFDGENLVWEPLTLPAASLAHLSLAQGKPAGTITGGTCFAWDNCWFFGTDGIQVHWDGQELTDDTPGLGDTPWLQGDFTAAAGVTTAGGANVGLAVNSGKMSVQPCLPGQQDSTGRACTITEQDSTGGSTTFEQGSTTTCPTPTSCPLSTQPDGSPAPAAFGSSGGPWSPLAFAPPDQTTVNILGMDGAGDAWAAAQPVQPTGGGLLTSAEPAPLISLAPNGTELECPGFGESVDAGSFTYGPGSTGFQWNSLAVVPDASMPDGNEVFAGAFNTAAVTPWNSIPGVSTVAEPAIVQGACGNPSTGTPATMTISEFRILDPLDSDQSSAQMVPADAGAAITAMSGSATNDVWAAAGVGFWGRGSTTTGNSADLGGPQRPHLYQFTDGQTPDALVGDDNETRPSLFTLSPPVFQVETTTVTVTPSVTTTTTKQKGKTKRKKLKPAIYGVRTRLQHGGTRKRPTYTLHLIFKLRRPTTVGLEALHGKRVVARAPMRRFKGRTGELSLPLQRKAWPTRLKLTTSPGQNGSGHSAPQPASQK
jgi:hypothetical protein